MENSSGQVEDYFNTMASGWSRRYDRNDRFHSRIEIFVLALTGRVPVGARILDLGCGTGDISRALADKGWTVTGCDISAGMVQAARANSVGIEFLQIDKLGRAPLPFPDGSFDAIIASSVLEYVENPAAALAECARLLKPGGYLVASVPDHRHWLRRLEAYGQKWPGPLKLAPWRRVENWRNYLRLSVTRPKLEAWTTWAGDAGLPIETWSSRVSPLALLIAKKD